jgi:hypothetical protein
MEIDLFNTFHNEAEKKGIMFYYSGAFSQSIIATISDILKNRFHGHDFHSFNSRKVFSSFIEMVQNAMHYSPEAPEAGGEKIGAIAVGKNESGAFLICANLIDKNYVEIIYKKIEAVNNMTIEEVKAAYKIQLRNENHNEEDDISKGAGLGLLTMARDSKSKIEYRFENVVGYEDRYAELHLKTQF